MVKLRGAIFKGAERDAGQMALSEHLREFRNRLMICVAAVGIFMIPAWFLYNRLVDILNGPYCVALQQSDPHADCKFLETNLFDPFALRLKIAGYGGLFLAMPIILWQLWRFIAPGLYRQGAALRPRVHAIELPAVPPRRGDRLHHALQGRLLPRRHRGDVTSRSAPEWATSSSCPCS